MLLVVARVSVPEPRRIPNNTRAKALSAPSRSTTSLPFPPPRLRFPCMDCGSTGTAAGIDPKILDNWQTDATFSISPWEHPPYEQPLEWDNSQDSTQDDADIVELNALHGSLAKNHSNAAYLDQSCGFRSGESRCGPPHPFHPLHQADGFALIARLPHRRNLVSLMDRSRAQSAAPSVREPCHPRPTITSSWMSHGHIINCSTP